MRETWTFPSFESFWRDVRYAVRALARQPGFAVVAVMTLAIGIGANAATFSLVDAVFLRGLPYPNADRLVVLIGNVQRATVERRGGSYPDYLDWRAQARTFDDLAVYTDQTVTLTGGDEPMRVNAEAVSAPYFSLLGVTAARGRVFSPSEDAVGGRDAVMILGDGLWRSRFGGDPNIVGQAVTLGTQTFQVIGVMPPDFKGATDTGDMWIPYVMSGAALTERGSRGFQVLGRLKAGRTMADARAEMAGISERLARAYPETNDKRGVEISPLAIETFGQLTPVVGSLMAAVGLVLLLACANVANLLIARSETRRREIAVRTALGAGRARLLRQLVTEGVVLTVLGGAAGLLLAEACLRVLVATTPVTLPTFIRPHLDFAVIAFTTAIAGACGLLLGLAPAAHARVARLSDALKDSARGSSSAMSLRMRNLLMVAELSLAVVLLVGAGLLIRSVQNLTAINPGFNPDGVATVRVSVPRQTAPAGPAVPNAPPPPFVTSAGRLLERVLAIPGVTAASLGSDTPLDGSASAIFYAAEGDTTTSAQTIPRAYFHRVTPGFFDSLGIALRQGRTFQPSELTAGSTAVIVSERVVQRFWPKTNPIGRRIKFGQASSPNPWMTIIGVVPDVKYRALPDNPTQDPDLYLPYVDRGQQGLLVRTSLDASSILPAVRAAIREIDPSIVVYNAGTLPALVATQTAASRFTAWMMSVFAGVALLLSVVGVYGVMSYLVTQRQREIGVRLALGASQAQVARLVVGNAARLIAAGVVVGVAGAFALRQLLEALLFGVSRLDVSGAIAVIVLVAVALASCLIPALRAARLSPLIALRGE
jgi:putative ABC transport system permease protein